MSKSLEEIVYGICLDEYSSAENRIRDIKRAVEDWTFEQEKEKRISKGLKAQMTAFTQLMKEIKKDIDRRARPEPVLLPRVYVDDNSDVAYFGTCFMLFAIETGCQFLREFEQAPPIPFAPLYHKDAEKYGKCKSLFDRYTPWERKFEVVITFPELLAAKRLNLDDRKESLPFFREIANISDSEDKIHRWFNAYTLLQGFKILGLDSAPFLCTDNYSDAATTAGFNEYLGNFKLITTFSAYNGAYAQYKEETEKRRAKIEASRKEQEKLVNDVVARGKARKIKFTRLQIPDMPADSDLPF